MPSEGSPRVTFRCPRELLAWLEEQVAKSRTRFQGEHTISSLLVQLVEEGRAKRERSRTWRRRKKQLQQEREAGG
ncbi:hypothetical protein GobsT_71590 [Gemmata obscuriglobus]|uniref:CopG-like ribbon-helix-helix domain-containing protein n=1 Tax=Gemmata obscuriglobus TaxID=114 RepID=A0A2Z3HIT8_9BACT|nr:hypothetical protein [Gemmata obscuriglobus]AWM41744.1 hypothetical protein C1280_35270 [Gemmata obscuriglobus]QEG32306.1 hypothetical protein GobsT_71590 [Gemmata obscuriglobus]VTS11662.1 unnamed protein product [Gemmata obscuriglobus UQM 2246]